ncbi:N-formylglutamate amidohydrolase [Jannaschia marina]|uniref:N-formylglutamate amidohydrolase n=1 Tax=Jannaschia marina TaxID=2741674 RepID=UPI002E295B88|nr:N-formylglutamate amidohydrolase [Jannaschia marina]
MATAPVVVASPHSGREYDDDFMGTTVLDLGLIRSSEDAFVDMLVEGVTDIGVPFIAAGMPRAFIDLNRAAEELDPAVIRDVPRGNTNPRVSSGLGVIPRVVAQGRAIYRGKISKAEARHRIEAFWRPYHDQLDALLSAARTQFGQAILLDCHSMPHEAIAGATAKGRQAEIVLGDRFGSSAAAHHVDALEEIFRGLGFRVARNAPFAGAYITQAYGQPERDRHAIQIEIDRALYMDEDRVERTENFAAVRNLMVEAIGQFCDGLRGPRDLAAE